MKNNSLKKLDSLETVDDRGKKVDPINDGSPYRQASHESPDSYKGKSGMFPTYARGRFSKIGLNQAQLRSSLSGYYDSPVKASTGGQVSRSVNSRSGLRPVNKVINMSGNTLPELYK